MNNIEKDKFIRIILSIYIILIGVGLPLIVRDKYFDILVFKYYYYCSCTIVMLAILLVYSILTKIKWFESLSKEKIKTGINKLTWPDFFVLVFYLIASVSTITSDYVYESFWGNEGRLTGLFLITGYVITYLCISKLWRFRSKYVDYILFAGIVVCLLGISDYFKLDILGFKAPMLENQKDIFTSTIGNINTYTAYIGMIVALTTVLFSFERNIKRTIFYFICMLIGFFAIIMGVSDNAYLSLGALFGILPLFLFKNNIGLRRYIIVIATFFSVVQCISWINDYMGNRVIGINSSFNLIANFRWLLLLITIFWLIVGIWFFHDHIKKKNIIEYGKTLCYCWLGLLLLLFVSILFIIYDCNFLNNVNKYGNLSSFLLLDDEWGTHRGYIWRNAMECYFRFPIWHKLVGYGPETLGILLLQKTVNNPYNEIFDNAHNEYLQLLITVGVIGLISYISFIISVIKRGLKLYSDNYYVVAAIFGIICYSIQALVNLNLPIITPVFWILLGIASAKHSDM
ncbi:polymerase [Lacrimispora algidixylanolytica]|uniref:Polymerase n=2 Tax=Lacrimispora algidixylanolytica TaxID=94868 RepID=A0A419TD53_9FIRM|nr:polymerase [Lacrimispora algidixylanolytica]